MYNVQHADAAFIVSETTENTLLVRSMFATIQGEGPYMGRPSVFLRLGGCNYGPKNIFCAFCDTDFRVEESRLRSFDELLTDLQAYATQINKSRWDLLLVITGGEPTLQGVNLSSFVLLVSEAGWEVQLETNGTHLDRISTMARASCTIVVSPKASIRGRYPDYSHLGDDYIFKFIVDARSDAPHHELPAWAFKRQQRTVYISPIAVYAQAYDGEVADAWTPGLLDVELTRRNYQYAAELCMRYGLNLSIQQHLFAAIP